MSTSRETMAHKIASEKATCEALRVPETEYQGYTNSKTWNAALLIFQERDLYEDFLKNLQRFHREGESLEYVAAWTHIFLRRALTRVKLDVWPSGTIDAREILAEICENFDLKFEE